MIDSGASRDIIDSSVHRNLKLPTSPISSVSLAMADDTPIVCNSIAPGTVVKFSTSKKAFSDIIDLSIIDLKGKFDIILGQPFLVRRNPHIDWVNRTMTFLNIIQCLNRM